MREQYAPNTEKHMVRNITQTLRQIGLYVKCNENAKRSAFSDIPEDTVGESASPYLAMFIRDRSKII